MLGFEPTTFSLQATSNSSLSAHCAKRTAPNETILKSAIVADFLSLSLSLSLTFSFFLSHPQRRKERSSHFCPSRKCFSTGLFWCFWHLHGSFYSYHTFFDRHLAPTDRNSLFLGLLRARGAERVNNFFGWIGNYKSEKNRMREREIEFVW